MNADILEKFQNLPVLKEPVDATLTPKRSTDIETEEVCILCPNKEDSKWKKWFEEQQEKENNLDILEDRLIRCGHTQCRNFFHLSCITHERPLWNFSAQYLAMDRNYDAIWCPEHFCHTCFREGLQQTASIGELLKDHGSLRSFHKMCLPSGYARIEENFIYFNEELDEETWQGQHMGICISCGDDGNKEDGEEMLDCSTCCQSFHKQCDSRTIDTVDVTNVSCHDCHFRNKTRIGDIVLIHQNQQIVAARTAGWSWTEAVRPGYVNVQIPSMMDTVAMPAKALFRPSPLLADFVYASWQRLNPNASLEARDQIKMMLQEIRESRPLIRRPEPILADEYKHHSSFTKTANAEILKEMAGRYPSSENTKIMFSKVTGYGVHAAEDIGGGVMVGQYIGLCTSKKENDKRKELIKKSCDREAKYYSMKSFFKNKRGKQIPFTIDASTVHNCTAIMNHSCDPNCIAYFKKIKVGESWVEMIVIKTKRRIAKDEEMTLSYHWTKKITREVCRCSEAKCKRQQIKDFEKRWKNLLNLNELL